MDLDGTLLAPAVTALNISAQTSGSITPYHASVTVPIAIQQLHWDQSCSAMLFLRWISTLSISRLIY